MLNVSMVVHKIEVDLIVCYCYSNEVILQLPIMKRI